MGEVLIMGKGEGSVVQGMEKLSGNCFCLGVENLK